MSRDKDALTASARPADASEPLTLDTLQQEVLCEEIARFVDSLASPEAQAPYVALQEAVEAGQVDASLMAPLETVLDILLESGRVRRMHGPQAESALGRIFNRTGRGVALQEAIRKTNRDLQALQGHRIREIRCAMKMPGAYQLIIDTDRCQLTLEIDKEGLAIRNLTVDL